MFWLDICPGAHCPSNLQIRSALPYFSLSVIKHITPKIQGPVSVVAAMTQCRLLLSKYVVKVNTTLDLFAVSPEFLSTQKTQVVCLVK